MKSTFLSPSRDTIVITLTYNVYRENYLMRLGPHCRYYRLRLNQRRSRQVTLSRERACYTRLNLSKIFPIKSLLAEFLKNRATKLARTEECLPA